MIFSSIVISAAFNLALTGIEKTSTSTGAIILRDIMGKTELLSLVGTRMLIQLKETAEQNPGEGGSLRLPTHASTDVFRTISAREESAPAQSQEACLSLLLS